MCAIGGAGLGLHASTVSIILLFIWHDSGSACRHADNPCVYALSFHLLLWQQSAACILTAWQKSMLRACFWDSPFRNAQNTIHCALWDLKNPTQTPGGRATINARRVQQALAGDIQNEGLNSSISTSCIALEFYTHTPLKLGSETRTKLVDHLNKPKNRLPGWF